MKLRNKKTGEIIDADFNATISGRTNIIIIQNGPEQLEYNSLAELNEEWEDVPEEPKGTYFINTQGDIQFWDSSSFAYPDDWTKEKQIGNYFETKEEAEKAVEKLKAWKRLKDKNFKFRKLRTANIGGDKHYFAITAEVDDADKTDLDLLFSGGEE